jgi:murein DD-endopeptidase MepM/ murein hydrolase activator NlpD
MSVAITAYGVTCKAHGEMQGTSGFSSFVSVLAWLLVVSCLVGLRPSEVSAAWQMAVRKEVASAKARPTNNVPTRRPTNSPTRNALLRQPIQPPLEPSDEWEHLIVKSRAGDNFAAILTRLSMPQGERSLWERSIRRDIGNRSLPAGKDIHFYFTKTNLPGGRTATGQLKAIEVDDTEALALSWEKGIRGILFQRREKPFDVEVKTVSGVVDTSLFEDGRKAGLQPVLLSQLADIFTWDIDLEKEVHKGDTFKILYEQRSRRGQESKSTLRILAAELINSGHKMTAIYFQKPQGEGNYYNEEGRSLARAFLRFPLEFSSITSHFTDSRFHPLLKSNLPHTGVDFAAQRGTPVRAVGDGIIAEAGWNGGYGKAIDLKHDATYMSRYAHLDRFADGIQPGVVITKGQVIGYVGSTGRSTGPHLHFELYKDQQYVNPLSVDFPADESIEPGLQKVFESQMRTYLVELSSAPQS